MPQHLMYLLIVTNAVLSLAAVVGVLVLVKRQDSFYRILLAATRADGIAHTIHEKGNPNP